MARLTTHPFHEFDTKPTTIGHDVWIGANTVVMSGLTIGTGSCIGAGSVVTRDVPPYAIAYGNPARVRRYRFKPTIIKELIESEWWNYPHNKITAISPEAGPLEALRSLRGD
jgi:acetyltransferase-like isoleucine patch superfamily enzyme